MSETALAAGIGVFDCRVSGAYSGFHMLGRWLVLRSCGRPSPRCSANLPREGFFCFAEVGTACVDTNSPRGGCLLFGR